MDICECRVAFTTEKKKWIFTIGGGVPNGGGSRDGWLAWWLMSMMADRHDGWGWEGGVLIGMMAEDEGGRWSWWLIGMMDDGNEGYDEGSDEGDDEGGDKVEWLILRCRD